MNIIIHSLMAGKAKMYKDVEAVPRVGDCVAEFYRPFPTVQHVIWFPDDIVLKELEINPLEASSYFDQDSITAIVLVR